MASPSVEALRHQLEAEQAAHAAAMRDIAEQTRNFQSVMAEDQQAFSDLITRVTNLRVRRGECMAAQVATSTPQTAFRTGSESLDAVLQWIQSKLEGPTAAPTSSASSTLQLLETAALEAMTPFGARRLSSLFTSNAAAVRQTGLLLLFPNDVRGVRAWARRHFSNCASCTARLARLPSWTPHRYDSKASGFACAPDLRAIPGKRYHHLTCSLLQERSLADRVDVEQQQQLDLLRGTFFLHVQSAGTARPLTDAPAACQSISEALQEFLQSSMAEVRDVARTAAPWSVGANANSEVSAAVEILLHMLQPRVMVEVVPQPAATRAGAPCTLVQVRVSLSVPLQVSAVAPLLRLLHDEAHRRYLVDHVLTPVMERCGQAIGAGERVAHYTAVGVHFVGALYRIAVKQGLVGEKAEAKPAETLTQIYYVLQALAVFGTTVEVEIATPSLHLHDTANATTSNPAPPAHRAKRAALRLLRSLLLHLTPPTPLTVPPASDPDFTELTVRVARAPTSFLEIVNRAFSSNHRMPSTSRSSTLDSFMSPKSKISLGLKLFRELVVDVYRPYHPSTGVIVAAENGTGGRARAPVCVPVIDVPVDIVAANVEVATHASRWLDAVRQREDALDAAAGASAESAPPPSVVEKVGSAALAEAAERLRNAAFVQRLHARWAAAQVSVVESPKSCMDVVLPFSMTETDVRSATKPLLYLRVVYDC